MPPRDHTGVPIHFHSSTISGSAASMISRTFASVFPRQSPKDLIFSSINLEADSTATGFFIQAPILGVILTCPHTFEPPPEEVGEPPKCASPYGPAPRRDSFANRKMGYDR